MSTPVVLSYGMGVDSTAILLRWLEEPRSRDFDLEDLTVVTAMLGDEWPDTKRLVEEHILPRLREHGVRYVQIARAAMSMRAGVAVLDDSTSPRKLHIEGAFRLSDELRRASTLPVMANRRCTLKFKGWVLDRWLRDEFGDRSFLQVIGFNADEKSRVERDSKAYTTIGETGEKRVKLPGRKGDFPLMGWGWGRKAVEDYCEEVVGEPWAKSCCTYCPFQRGKASERKGLEMPEATLVRYRDYPEAAAEALMLEYVTLAFNPLIPLFANEGSLRHLLQRAGITTAEKALQKQLHREPWSIYHLRRYFTAAGGNGRSIRRYGTTQADHDTMANILSMFAQEYRSSVTEDEYGILRVSLRERKGKTSTQDEFLVLAPSRAQEKEKPSFAKAWAAETGERLPPAPRAVVEDEDE
ncbi:MAG: hypothetical protein WC969_15520 [Elusimicrobiota bacterium]